MKWASLEEREETEFTLEEPEVGLRFGEPKSAASMVVG